MKNCLLDFSLSLKSAQSTTLKLEISNHKQHPEQQLQKDPSTKVNHFTAADLKSNPIHSHSVTKRQKRCLNAAKEIVAIFAFSALITSAAAAGEYQTNPNLNHGKKTKKPNDSFFLQIGLRELVDSIVMNKWLCGRECCLIVTRCRCKQNINKINSPSTILL